MTVLASIIPIALSTSAVKMALLAITQTRASASLTLTLCSGNRVDFLVESSISFL